MKTTRTITITAAAAARSEFHLRVPARPSTDDTSDSDFAPAWAAQHGIEDASLEALAHNDAIRAAVQEGVDAANAKLARVEQIKYFTIVEGDWLPGGDELTPTMKLKRKPIDAKYAEAIDAMYAH